MNIWVSVAFQPELHQNLTVFDDMNHTGVEWYPFSLSLTAARCMFRGARSDHWTFQTESARCTMVLIAALPRSRLLMRYVLSEGTCDEITASNKQSRWPAMRPSVGSPEANRYPAKSGCLNRGQEAMSPRRVTRARGLSSFLHPR